MSLGNLRTQGSKGTNYPYQIKNLQIVSALLEIQSLSNLTEVSFSEISVNNLETAISTYFSLNTDKYLVSKSIIFDGTNYVAFLTIAS